jgi:multidrug resistance efflux pump
MRRVFSLIAVFLTGCNSMSRMPASPPLPVVDPTPIINRRTNLVPRELKLKLTLDDPADLKVKSGDLVKKGQVIGDRTSARNPLEQERQAIHLKLEHLKASAEAGSSHVSYSVEQARVRQAQVRVQQAREAIAQFKTHSPWTEYALASLPLYKESTKVSQLKTKVREAETELDLAVAQLEAAREKKPANQDKSVQQTLLMSQLKDVEVRLAGMGVVRSPYDGIVKKIKWVEQVDRELQVDLILIVRR